MRFALLTLLLTLLPWSGGSAWLTGEDGPAQVSAALTGAGERLTATAGNGETDAADAGAEGAGGAEAGLSPDLIYNLLVGEVAGQRQELRLAYIHHLQAAKLARDPQLAERATSAALASEDLDAAKQATLLWLDLAPDSLAARLAAAHVALRQNEPEQGRRHLRQLVGQLRLGGREGFLQVAALVATIDAVEDRLELMRALRAADPDNPAVHYGLAMVLADAERYRAAIDSAREAIALDPEWDKPRIVLVRLLLAQDRRQEAREVLEQFVDSMPDDHVLRMLYAQLLVEDQAFSDARNVFERMLRTTPKEPDVLFAIGVLSLQLDDTAAAREYFQRLFATGQRRDDAALYLGQIAELTGDLEKALEWYAKVEGQNELDAEVRRARVFVELGEIDKGRERLERLRERYDEHGVALFLIEAELLREAGRPEQVLAVYDAALAAHPDNHELLYARALHAVSLGQVEQLEHDLRRILAADADHADALNALGYTLADQTERYQEAYDYIKRALTLKPEEPAVLDSMGWVLFKMGRLEEAIEYLQRAYERMPDGEIGAHLGEVLWHAGQRDKAWRIWDEALAADPQDEYLQRVIDRYDYSRGGAQQ